MKTKACRAPSSPMLAPIRLSRTAWYYEEDHGLTVVAEKRADDGKLISVVQTKIPWRKLESSLARKPKRKAGGK